MRIWLCFAALFAAACSCAPTARPVLASADALWGDGGSRFCARSGGGVQCWSADDLQFTTAARIEGLGDGTRTVVFGSGFGCALDGERVLCFAYYEPSGASVAAPIARERAGLGDASELVAFDTTNGPRMLCALEREGGRVSCWRDLDQAPDVLVEAGAVHLHESTGSTLVCVEASGGNLACHDLRSEAVPYATLSTTIAPPLRRVDASTIFGEMLVLDAEGLRFGRGQSSLVVTGNPFGAENPLDVAAHHVRIPEQRIELRRMDAFADASELLAGSSGTFVLDRRGVWKMDSLGSQLDAQPVPLGRPADALLARYDRGFYARAGDALVVYQHGAPAVEPVDGIVRPRSMVVGIAFGCVLHDGGVSCIPVPD